MQIQAIMDRAGRILPDSPSARLDVEVLLAHALGKPRSWLYANPRVMLDTRASEAFDALVGRRRKGEPVAYLTGIREFWSLPLKVTPAVLIPRPETELLVELALRALPGKSSCRVADLGTGSGAIALALAKELPEARIIATESNAKALDVARLNAQALGIGREQVEFRPGDWFEPLTGERFDCIVSNPPYVRDDDPHLDQGDVRFEPRSALAAGPEGMDALRRIIEEAPFHLVRGGRLVLEHGHDQQPMLVTEIEQMHPGATVDAHADHAGQPRAVVVQFTR